MDDLAYAERVEAWSARSSWATEAADLVKRCNPVSGRYALDIGTNTGAMLAVMRAQGLLPIGTEPNDAARELAFNKHGLRIAASVHEAYRLVNRQAFWIVTLSHVLGHVKHPDVMLGLAADVLASNGRIGLILPNPVFDKLSGPANWLSGYKSDPTIQHMIGLPELQSMLPPNFEIKEVWYAGETPKGWPASLMPDKTRSRLCVTLGRVWS